MEDLGHSLCWKKEGVCHWLNTWPRDSSYRKQLRQSHWHPPGNWLYPHCPSPLHWAFPRNKAHKSPGLSVPESAMEVFPETRLINLPDCLSPNQSSPIRGHYLANTCTQDTWGRSAGWPTPLGVCYISSKTLLPFPSPLQSARTQPAWSQCPASNKNFIGPFWLPVLS